MYCYAMDHAGFNYMTFGINLLKMCVSSRLVPTPFSVSDHAEQTQPFFVFEPSKQGNGFFLAPLSSEESVASTDTSKQ